MQSPSRHQCLIYSGSPAQHLPALGALMRGKLEERHRCLYLDSPPLVTGIRSYLSAAGVDVAREIESGSLVLSSDQGHVVDNVELMLRALEDAVQQALNDGYLVLCATGDMTWEVGSRKELAKLLEYEGKLEELFRRRPFLCGICQYHADSLPAEAVGQGLLTHPSLFINQTLSRVNPRYLPRERVTAATPLPDFRDLVEDS
jgi:hypothetical protein